MSAALLLALALGSAAEPIHPDDALATSARDLDGLAALAREGTWNERIHAVHMLGRMGPRAVPALSEAARDADWQVRLGAVHWLGRQGTKALKPLSWSLANDPCPIPRLAALHWLGSLGPEGMPAIEEALGDDSQLLKLNHGYWKRKASESAGPPDAAAAAADDLALRREYDEDLERCRRSLKPGLVEPVRGDAAPGEPVTDSALAPAPAADPIGVPETLAGYETLAERGEPEDAPPALEAPARAGPALELSAPATGTAEKLAGPPAVPSRDELVRAEALLMGDNGKGPPPHDALPLLLAALRGGDARLKSRAADAIGFLAEKAAEAAPDLGRALGDPSPRVRESAALALGKIGPAADAQARSLEKALGDKNAAVRHSAALSLGRIGTPRARKAFERYLRRQTRGD